MMIDLMHNLKNNMGHVLTVISDADFTHIYDVVYSKDNMHQYKLFDIYPQYIIYNHHDFGISINLLSDVMIYHQVNHR